MTDYPQYGSEQFPAMTGKVFASVVATEDALTFENDNEKFVFYHEQDCCENVEIKDITGDLADLVGAPILLAEMTWRNANDSEVDECGTWSYYKFRTHQGDVTVCWLGESNGYYSETVDLTHTIKESKNGNI